MKHAISSFLITSCLLFASQPLTAQEGTEYEVVLPDTAQTCVLPTAPDAIPEGATRDQLLEAKAAVGTFQEEIAKYRDCLSVAEAGDITPGNQEAIVSSYNYTVEMEERVAGRFNEALCAYMEGQGQCCNAWKEEGKC